ncbi:MAG TPA: hypothetical protein VG845_12810, partial [Dehalococcoidia bacterium]|nr:hypothetical protein [Dehalococcoidia bacterium]
MQPSASRHVRLQDFASGLARPLRNADPHVIDALVALALTVIAVAIVVGRPADDGDFRSDDALGMGLVLLQTLPLALRRFAPLPVLIVISAALVLHSALGYEVVQAGTISSLIAVYGAAALTDTRGSIIAAAITGAAIAGFYATNRGDWTIVDAATTSATWGIAWVLGT